MQILLKSVAVEGGIESRPVLILNKGETFRFEYRVTPSSGNADVPSSATLTIAASLGGAAVATDAATITDNTTSYDVAFSISEDTIDDLSGRYYFGIKEIHATYRVKMTGELYVNDCVEATP